MIDTVAIGSTVFVPGKEWKGCDPFTWYPGVVEKAGPKRVSVRYPDCDQLCQFDRALLEEYQGKYSMMKTLQEQLVNEFGTSAGDAFTEAMQRTSEADMVQVFADAYGRELQRKAAVDLLAAVMYVDSFFIA